MSRSGYVDYCDDDLAVGRWRGVVKSAIRGKRGQQFLRELAAAMDAMEDKSLIADELIDNEGRCCTIRVHCRAPCKIEYDNIGGVDSVRVSQLADPIILVRGHIAYF